MLHIPNREIKIEVCIKTANGKPQLEVSGHAFEVCCTKHVKFAVNVARRLLGRLLQYGGCKKVKIMLRNTFELFYCYYFHFLQHCKTTVIYLKLSDYCLCLIGEILASYRKL